MSLIFPFRLAAALAHQRPLAGFLLTGCLLLAFGPAAGQQHRAAQGAAVLFFSPAQAAAGEQLIIELNFAEMQAGGPQYQGQEYPAGQSESGAGPPTADGPWQVERRRQVLRRFAVPVTGRPFGLDTRYGRVQLLPWDKAEIRVEAELVARSETEAGARQVLDALGVQVLEYDARTGGVAIASQFGPALRGGSGAGRRFEINYRIWLPRTTPLRVAAAFSEVSIGGDLRGPTDLHVDYGSLRTGRLDGARNRVRVSNGDCAILYARQASLDMRFARLQLEEGQIVDLRNNYSDISIGTVNDLTVHSRYGDVALGQVQSLRGESGYSRISVEHLSEELNMALNYCPDFEVRDFGPNFRQVTLDGGFSTIRLGFAEAPAFHFDVSTEQGQLLVERELVRILSQATTARRCDVLGTFGVAEARTGRAARPAGRVNVRMRHGTVRFSR